MKILEFSSSQVLEVDSMEEDENITYNSVSEKSFGLHEKCLNTPLDRINCYAVSNL